MVDLTQAVVVHPAQMSKVESKAVDMLIDEMEKRTRIRWRTAQAMPADGAVISISRQASNIAEGYSIRVRKDGGRDVVSVVGNDARGVLFGVGKLLRLPRIDAVFVPGGDPGHTQPKHLMALLEKQAQNLRRTHPKAQMWVAPQGVSQAWMDEFIELLKVEPPWLTGVVFGP